MKIVIIGAGIIGASIAYALSVRGATVTVLEQALPASGATSKSFGWINATAAQTPEYYRLRMAGIAEYKALSAALDLEGVTRFHGGLWWEEEGIGLDNQADALAGQGYEIEILDRDGFTALEPRVANPPDRCIRTLLEGAADPTGLTHALLTAAAAHGATVLTGCRVENLLRDGAATVGVNTSAGTIWADRIVLAGGTATGDLLVKAGMSLPMDNKPGLILHSDPVPPVLRHLILSPEIHFWQKPDGALIAGDEYGGGAFGDNPAETAARVMEKVQNRLPGVGPLRTSHIMMGTRPMPADGYPAIGEPVPGSGLYIAVMHSGITLGPVIGRLAAEELMGGGASDLLAPYRPARFS